jgi:hypothetical protein
MTFDLEARSMELLCALAVFPAFLPIFVHVFAVVFFCLQQRWFQFLHGDAQQQKVSANCQVAWELSGQIFKWTFLQAGVSMDILGIDSRGLIGCLWTQLYYVSITKNQMTCPTIKKADVSSSLRLFQVN